MRNMYNATTSARTRERYSSPWTLPWAGCETPAVGGIPKTERKEEAHTVSEETLKVLLRHKGGRSSQRRTLGQTCSSEELLVLLTNNITEHHISVHFTAGVLKHFQSRDPLSAQKSSKDPLSLFALV
ncbi:hypothetical protein WMY93_028951 [Mugilogobius chulae]|uniref:Uncharacterized protein n=1 Tax=Mugilogobius chulae TaxID=88201 RepID=A0AAW0MUH8_9GOBI